jgi:transcription antitermination protein NusB
MMVKKFHEMVLQILFSSDYVEKEEGIVDLIMSELKVSKSRAKEAYLRVQSILEKRPDIDQKIKEHSTEYQFERISQVEKNILRWGVFELLYGQEARGTIYAEALRLCRKFSTPFGTRFVHAILEQICLPLKPVSNQENG